MEQEKEIYGCLGEAGLRGRVGPGSVGDTVISHAQEREDKWKFIA